METLIKMDPLQQEEDQRYKVSSPASVVIKFTEIFFFFKKDKTFYAISMLRVDFEKKFQISMTPSLFVYKYMVSF